MADSLLIPHSARIGIRFLFRAASAWRTLPTRSRHALAMPGQLRGVGRQSPIRAVRLVGYRHQDPERTIEPSLIPSTFTERRLILSYSVCFGMLKSRAVA